MSAKPSGGAETSSDATGDFLPLQGRRVLVTRAEEQAGAFMQRLRELGAEPIPCPTIAIAPPEDWAQLDDAIARLGSYDWIIFTSVNGVRFFFERLHATGGSTGWSGRLHIAAIGPATARAVEAHGLGVAFVPEEYVAESIVAGMPDVAGRRILLPRADIARKALVEGLVARGAVVDEVTAYRTVSPIECGTLPEGGDIDIATFTSPSTVHNFVALFENGAASSVLRGAAIACIGPITAQAARQQGLPVTILARQHTLDGLLEAIIRFVEEQA